MYFAKIIIKHGNVVKLVSLSDSHVSHHLEVPSHCKRSNIGWAGSAVTVTVPCVLTFWWGSGNALHSNSTFVRLGWELARNAWAQREGSRSVVEICSSVTSFPLVCVQTYLQSSTNSAKFLPPSQWLVRRCVNLAQEYCGLNIWDAGVVQANTSCKIFHFAWVVFSGITQASISLLTAVFDRNKYPS